MPINVKAENLAKIYAPNIKPIDEDSLVSRVKEIEFRGETVVVVSEADEASARILKTVVNTAVESGAATSLTVGCERSAYSWCKKVCEGLSVNVKQITGSELVQYGTKILISRVSFDPLFGFSGGAAALLKMLQPTFVAEAFKRMQPSEPKPGEETEASFYAYSEAEPLDMLGVEYIFLSGVLVEVAVGELIKAHKQISQTLLEICRVNLSSRPEAVIASAGLGNPASTLASALNTLWNVVRPLDGCVVIFFAECVEGLGSEALRLAATRDIETFLAQAKYIDGLENVIFLKWLSGRTKVALVSTLPRYYVTKLGFDYIRSASETLPYLLKQKGSRVKIHIFPNAENTLLTLTK